MTLLFSQDSCASIAHVIPTMDHIDLILCNGSENKQSKQLHPAVKHTLVFARNRIDKYYGKTDLSNVYHIAMSRFFIFDIAVQLANAAVMHAISPSPPA